MKTIKTLFIFNALFFGLFSCVRYKNTILLNSQKSAYDSSFSQNVSPYKIQNNDVLEIDVASTDAASMSIFTKSLGGGNMSSISESSLYMKGYVVDGQGKISIPVLGDVFVAGKTKNEIKDSIQLRINKYFKYATVDVKMASYRLSFLGEIKNSGTQMIYRENINLIEALALCGGFTEVAKRDKVKILRKINGKTEIRIVDFTKENLINHEWYQLMPNDVIYVEPIRLSAFRSNSTSLSFTLSAVSVLLLLFSLTNRN